jgi:DNA-binding transcriptional regulator GbsR (MarR family)
MTDITGGQNDALHELVDEMGLFFKNLGVARAAGQMFGYLMACHPPEQSAGEISAAVGASLASVSTNTRLLIQLGAIEQTHRRGDRKTYHRLREDFWLEMTTRRLGMFESLARTIRRIESGGELPRGDGADEMVEFAEFWQQELPKLTERWKTSRAATREKR